MQKKIKECTLLILYTCRGKTEKRGRRKITCTPKIDTQVKVAHQVQLNTLVIYTEYK